MDLPENSNGIDKSWDRPWTTDEMRQKRNEWSLAADAGLLEHLKQFSNNLTENVQKTKEKLNLLTSDLNETSVIIDNITNVSLALANTQFIESRVYEDDVETKKPETTEDQKANDEELNKEDLIVCVSENIKQGLRIMDEKYQRVEVDASDSDDEGEIHIPSVVLRPRDPYENRPLPYVIGSDKWKASSKVGLESSSSDSEPPEAEDSASDDNDNVLQSDMMVNNRRESMTRRSSFTSSESSDRDQRGNTVKHHSGVSSRTDKLEARSQDTLNSGSEMATPSIAESRPESSSKGTPSFAEELAKRLGNVMPSGNPPSDSQEADRSSIDRSTNDLFAPDDGDVFGANAENPFGDSGNLFDAEVSSSLWKDRPIRVPKTNIIPPSLDVPPPIHDEASKPRSAFDDLCGDADSEDSDDIFSCKSSSRNAAHQPTFTSGNRRENKFLETVQNNNATNLATSTPETNDNGGIFGDESDGENDDLFGKSVTSRNRITERSPEVTRTANRTKAPGLSITQADLLSSDLGSRLFQRVPRQDSDNSSDGEAPMLSANSRLNEAMIPDDSNQNSALSSQNKRELSSIVAGNATRGSQPNVEDSDSSGVSVAPNSISNTPALGVDFQPQSESTRLRSEDIYRERVTSDSLFAPRSRLLDATSSTNNSGEQTRGVRLAGALDGYPEVDFDSDDVFGPPPLPTADSKSKSEAASVDDLFSNASSGSRSRKSSDLVAATEPQLAVKSAAHRSVGLFDEDIDIFGTADAPDLDIFSEGFTSTLPSSAAKNSGPTFRPEAGETSAKKIDLFASSGPADVGDNFASHGSAKKSARKPDSIFDDSEDDDDLFGSGFLKSKKPPAMRKPDDDNLFANTSRGTGETAALTAPKKDLARADGANESATKPPAKRDSDAVNTIGNAMPSYTSGGLFDNLDDDDDDSLFDDKKLEPLKEKSTRPKVEAKSVLKTEDSGESKMEKSELKSNRGKFEGLSKDGSDLPIGEIPGLKSSEKEYVVEKSSIKKSPKPAPNKKSAEMAAKKLSGEEKEEETATKKLSKEEKEEETASKQLSREEKEEEIAAKKLSKEEEVEETAAKKMLKEDKEEDISTTDGAMMTRPRRSPEAIGEVTKRLPPKTLSIRLPQPSSTEDSTQQPRRAVSGKIKNLMGKMGDLKILSPTDSPPLWKKSEEKSEADEEPTVSRDSKDGSSVSLPRAKTPPITSSKPDSSLFLDEPKEQPPSSPLDDSGNSESAVSFDVPAQVETLTVTASKSRARIQAKRRPQSRHARQSALRKSGIDFEPDTSENIVAGIADKLPTVVTDSVDGLETAAGFDRLIAPDADNERGSTDKPTESSSSLVPDDRSELSLSKGSSTSVNRNTLLSPSTDEEDLFDVPPDLPEDPPKEDALFFRAPILSPVDGFLGTKRGRPRDRSRENLRGIGKQESATNVDNDARSTTDESSRKIVKEAKIHEANAKDVEKLPRSNEEAKDPKKSTDPLRDSSHDPLKDPSQLFAFVTKTPSPEKGQNLLFKEDDSLFTRVARKSAEEAKAAASNKKNTLPNLFADDSPGDLFSAPLAKPAKKSSAPKSSGLFDDVDDFEDGASDLFGRGARSSKPDGEKVEPVAEKSVETSSSMFADDADDDLFVDALDKKFSPEPEKFSGDTTEDKLFPATSRVARDAKIDDLFGDQSSGEEDIFAPKKTIGAGRASAGGSMFSGDADDQDVADIFGTKSARTAPKVEPAENRASAKKPATRDLRKTAEKIVEDPLSMLQDD